MCTGVVWDRSRRRRGSVRALIEGAIALSMLAAVTAPASANAACANEAVRALEPYASVLPDCRAYEQVSPVDKGSVDALGAGGIVQSSPSGEGIIFYSIPPFPGVEGAAELESYLSIRQSDGWSTQGLLPRTKPEASDTLAGLTESLSLALVDVNEDPGFEDEPGNTVSYLRDDATGAYSVLGTGHAYFADATPNDSRILFEDRAKLTSNATAFEEEEEEPTNLYELNRETGTISLVDILPEGEGGEPAEEGAVAGPGGAAATEAEFPGGASAEAYTADTISEDGSRIFFTDLENGRIYAREPEVNRTVAVSPGQALFEAATPDGRYVFYLESEKLYRVDLNGGVHTPEPLTTAASPKMRGTLGVSADGAYVYFVAEGVLASNETEHENSVTKEKEKEKAIQGRDNLYEWHADAPISVSFIAQLENSDGRDWSYVHTSLGIKTARVTPDGSAVLFTSNRAITGYQNNPQGGCKSGGAECAEAFLYEAEKEELHCVSCNPNVSLAEYSTSLEGGVKGAPSERAYYLPRNLSDSGDRVFFDTEEALVENDVNNTTDVYEWEKSGAGTCGSASPTFRASSSGCLYLISTGTSSAESYFGDASANGNDVFFFTYQSLVGQDQDSNSDLYDARVEGGFQAQNPASPPASCEEEAPCRSKTSVGLVFGAPSSSTLAGNGNVGSSPETQPTTSKPAVPKPLTNSQRLTKALKLCAKKRSKKKRQACERSARKKYKGRTASAKRERRSRGRSR